MPFSYHDGTAWRAISALSYHDGTAWRTIQTASYHDGTAWRQVFNSAGPVNQFGGTVYAIKRTGPSAIANVTFNTNGTVSGSISPTTGGSNEASGDRWYSPTTTNIGSSYWIRATLTAGVTPSSGTMNTWQQLSSARLWENNSGSGATGNKSSTILFEISATSGGAVVCRGTFTIWAEHEPAS